LNSNQLEIAAKTRKKPQGEQNVELYINSAAKQKAKGNAI